MFFQTRPRRPGLAHSGKLSSNRARCIACMLSLLLEMGLSIEAQNAVQQASSSSGMISGQRSEALPPGSKSQHASDTVAYWFGSSYRTPFVLKPGTGQGANIARQSIEYTHLGIWSMGSNFADLMVNQSNMAEPASGGGVGATEIYATLRSDVGLNQVTHSKAFRFGPLRDVAVEWGANLEAKNSSYAPAERTIYFGPKLRFALPQGYFNLALHLRKEWNHEGVLGKAENYDPDFNMEPTWLLPFKIGRLHLAYGGFADYNTRKGKDSFGSPTAPEFLIRSVVSIDVGAALLHRSQFIDVSGGLWYWHNEYGKPSADPGASQATPFIGVAVHLDGGRASRNL